ncbi:MAG: hypothetical protein ACRCYU_01745, partial [Nocardioides sp.]
MTDTPENTPDIPDDPTEESGDSTGTPADPVKPLANNPLEEMFKMLSDGVFGTRPPGEDPAPGSPLGGPLRGGFGMSGDFSGPAGGSGAIPPGTPGGLPGLGGLPDLQQIFGQMQALMQPHDGPINWQYV